MKFITSTVLVCLLVSHAKSEEKSEKTVAKRGIYHDVGLHDVGLHHSSYIAPAVHAPAIVIPPAVSYASVHKVAYPSIPVVYKTPVVAKVAYPHISSYSVYDSIHKPYYYSPYSSYSTHHGSLHGHYAAPAHFASPYAGYSHYY